VPTASVSDSAEPVAFWGALQPSLRAVVLWYLHRFHHRPTHPPARFQAFVTPSLPEAAMGLAGTAYDGSIWVTAASSVGLGAGCAVVVPAPTSCCLPLLAGTAAELGSTAALHLPYCVPHPATQLEIFLLCHLCSGGLWWPRCWRSVPARAACGTGGASALLARAAAVCGHHLGHHVLEVVSVRMFACLPA